MKKLSELMKGLLVLIFTLVSYSIYSQNVADMSISEMEEKKNEAVASEDFEKAAQWKEVLDLKKAMNDAVASEDYQSAARYKEKLENHPLNGKPANTEYQPQYTPPPPPPPTQSTYDNTYSTTSSSNTNYGSQVSSKQLLMYNFGGYAPIGLFYGSLSSNSVGIYVAFRISGNAFGETSIYEMNATEGIDDDYWLWNYTDESQYRRGSATLGITFKMAGELDDASIHGYLGLGYGAASYMYEYEQIGPGTGTSYGYEWIKDTDLSTSGIETEAGMIFDIYGFVLSGGVTLVNFSEGMMTAGIGFSW